MKQRERSAWKWIRAIALGAAMMVSCAAYGKWIGAQEFTTLGEQISAAQESGDLALAEKLARQRLSVASDGQERHIGNAYRSLGNILSQRGRYAEAETMLRKAMPLIERGNGRLSHQAIRCQFSLAGVLMAQSRYAEADKVLSDTLTRQIAYRPHHPDLIHAYDMLAKIRTLLGRYTEAEGLLQKAANADVISAPADTKDTLGTQFWLSFRRAQTLFLSGWLDYRRHRYAEAERLGMKALAAYKEILHEDHPARVEAQIWVAWAILQQGRYAEAENILRPALMLAQKSLGPNHKETARAQLGLALSQAKQGNIVEAEGMMRKAVDNVRSAGSLDQFAAFASIYARFLIKDKHPVEAWAQYRNALGAVDRMFAQTRGLNEGTRGNFIARYGSFYTEAIQLLLSLNRAHPDQGYDQEILAVVSTTQSRMFTEMLRQADVGKFSTDRDFIDLKARQAALNSRLSELRQAHAEIVRTEETESERTDSTDTGSGSNRVAGSDDPIVQQRMEKRRAELDEETKAAEQELTSIESKLWEKYPRYMELTQPRAVTVEALQKSLLKPGETLLCYYLLPDRLLVFIVERGRFRLFEVEKTRKEIGELVAAARLPETEEGGPSNLAHLDPTVLNQLYQTIFAPVEPLLKEGQRLLVIGDGPLNTLPLEMLVTRWGDAEKQAFAAARGANRLPLNEYGTLSYLGQHYRFAYLPSLSALASARLYRKPQVHYERELVSFADPVFEKSGYSPKTQLALADLSRSVRSSSRLSIPRLPETADEAREIARILGGKSTLYLREQAQEYTAKTIDMKTTRYVHFATHGLLGGEFIMVREALTSESQEGQQRNLTVVAASAAAAQNAASPAQDTLVPDLDEEDAAASEDSSEHGQPALLLSLSGDLHGEDGLLTMGEIVETMDLNAQLAVLSACNTAGESAEANNGEGFAGLTRAFMYAGAQGVVVSHWSVDSRSTQEMMTELFRETRDGAESLSALDGARQKIRASKMPGQGVQQSVSRAHPFFWAPFVYVGD
jgi:CHAT domain-containing protein